MTVGSLEPPEVDYLRVAYERGQLVPFIGSGMSVPVCAGWEALVERLEAEAGIDGTRRGSDALIQRALFALQRLRRRGRRIVRPLRRAVYLSESDESPPQTVALASLFWPLVCTTNYDDVYLRAVLGRRAYAPEILGRSELDCRRVLQHLAFPVGEVVWCLQGFLGGTTGAIQKALALPAASARRLEDELVVGHAEYRQAAHRAPHFRRSFAELFRTRSLLFLGSGLAEPYFMMLFDEIIELTGPPAQPHFAFVEEGRVDPEFLRSQYHILCHVYPAGKHENVEAGLHELARTSSDRVDVRIAGVSASMRNPTAPPRMQPANSRWSAPSFRSAHHSPRRMSCWRSAAVERSGAVDCRLSTELGGARCLVASDGPRSTLTTRRMTG
jgi:SIR2-like protein